MFGADRDDACGRSICYSPNGRLFPESARVTREIHGSDHDFICAICHRPNGRPSSEPVPWSVQFVPSTAISIARFENPPRTPRAAEPLFHRANHVCAEGCGSRVAGSAARIPFVAYRDDACGRSICYSPNGRLFPESARVTREIHGSDHDSICAICHGPNGRPSSELVPWPVQFVPSTAISIARFENPPRTPRAAEPLFHRANHVCAEGCGPSDPPRGSCSERIETTPVAEAFAIARTGVSSRRALE